MSEAVAAQRFSSPLALHARLQAHPQTRAEPDGHEAPVKIADDHKEPHGGRPLSPAEQLLVVLQVMGAAGLLASTPISLATRSPGEVSGVKSPTRPDAADARRQAMNLLRERTQPRADIVEHNGLVTQPSGKHGWGTADVWEDNTWERYGAPEIQLENGARVPTWSKPVERVKEIKLERSGGTIPVSGKANEMLCVKLPGDPATGEVTVNFGATNSPDVVGPTFVRRGEEYYATVVVTTDYEGAEFEVALKPGVAAA